MGRQLDSEVKSLSSLGIKEMTPQRCDTDKLPELKAALNESKSALPRRSKKAS